MAETATVFVDPNLSAAERRQLGQSIISYVVTRTKRGLGKGREPFIGPEGRKYTQSYITSKEFKAAGKSPRPINLTLTGEMLDSIEVLDISLPGRIVYGFKADKNGDKAKYMREKNYNFLELTSNELATLENRFKKNAQTIDSGIATDLVRRLFGNQS